jgi:D-tyrosyl-tRNA(Tyr) deacylase
MKAVIQRVSKAQVFIQNKLFAHITSGFVLFLGVTHSDNPEDIQWLVQKVIGLRIFSDHNNAMNLDIHQVKGELMVISQFTLYASTKKGNRPSYIAAARPDQAEELYNNFIQELKKKFIGKVVTGKFGANMQVSLINDGPVTIIIDTKNKE